jgi:hypothetical protein
MEAFEEFVSEDRIIAILCKIRAKKADERNKAHLLRGLSPDIQVGCPPVNDDVFRMMPPRRKWVQLNKKNRYKLSDGSLLNTYDKNLKSLRMTISRDLKSGSGEPYIVNLKSLINSVKRAIVDPEYRIQSPVTYPESKHKSLSNDKIECRPISTYTDLKDRVIINLANKYFTLLFDKYFYIESLAFRAKRKYHSPQETYTNHHNAIDRIQEFRNKYQNRNIYVAECDMKKFYDTVNHAVVKKEFLKLLKKAKKDYPHLSFSCAERIFYSYLKSYTFPAKVYLLNDDVKYWKKHNIPKGRFEWVEDDLIKLRTCKSKLSLKEMNIGVPQGGALSGLIANIVLNSVDQKLLPKLGDNVLYLRYCDDMILFTTNKRTCRRIFKRYNRNLERLKLIPHQVDRHLAFGKKEFWKKKSKAPYKWDKTTGSDWIGFVGYEINRAGSIRIRKASFVKEKTKQVKVVKDLFRELKDKTRLPNGSIERSFINRLIAMSVGRITLWNHSIIPNELCWVNGFKRLNDNEYVATQIKNLDRCRNKQIYKAKKALRELEHTGIIHGPKDSDIESFVEYYGMPFSYYYHFKKNLHE